MITRLSKVDKLCPHFHLSVQSLDNNVLKRMNRKYTSQFVLDRVNMIRKYIKDALFTCDVIVGFPGETEEEFNNTFNMVKKINFFDMHVFKYSKRKWTKAATMENQIDGNISQKRREIIIEYAKENKEKLLNMYLGKIKEVLFEEYDKGYLYGYTDNYIKVKVKGDRKLWGYQQKIELCSIEGDLILGKLL